MSTTKPFATAQSTSCAVPLPTGGCIHTTVNTPVRQPQTLPASKSQAMIKSDANRMQRSIGGEGVGVA